MPKALWWLGGAVVLLLVTNAVLLAMLWRGQRPGPHSGRSGQALAVPAAPTPRKPNAAKPTVAPRGDLAAAEKTTVQIFRKAAPAVVYITTLAVREDIFRRNVMEIPRGTGSGFLWDRRGHVVTNFHVLQGAQAARVHLSDQSVWPAELVGVAPDKDLAVLRIKAPKKVLVSLPVGESHDLSVGQFVYAIGNPFGFDYTLSTGVISGLKREINAASGRPIQGVIQTDAAINPGNSGGPLLDSAGRLIGVNTAIYSPSGASAGIGFAVPVDTVRRVVPQLIKHGKVMRPGLGIQIANAALAKRLRVDGVVILGVQPGSPADKAGLRPIRRDRISGGLVLGDILIGLDGEALHQPKDLYLVLDRRKVGQQVTLKVLREGREMEKRVTLTALDDD
ncbi:MAG: S1C family serine protease [Polyangiales bacterium]